MYSMKVDAVFLFAIAAVCIIVLFYLLEMIDWYIIPMFRRWKEDIKRRFKK